MSLCECEGLAFGFYTLHTVSCWHRQPFTAALSLLVFGSGSWSVQEDATLLVNVLAVWCVVLSQGAWLALLMERGSRWETAPARGGSGLPWQGNWICASGMFNLFECCELALSAPFLF